MKCPVCKLEMGCLYQYSYPGEPEYISPRCGKCYSKAERKLERKLAKFNDYVCDGATPEDGISINKALEQLDKGGK